MDIDELDVKLMRVLRNIKSEYDEIAEDIEKHSFNKTIDELRTARKVVNRLSAARRQIRELLGV